MKIRSERTYLLFLGLIATAPPLATDMYLPAIPDIARLWGVAESQVNLSLVLWFACYSLSLLFCGSFSDKYGRKPVLFFGLSLFVGASFFCAMSANVWQLIAYRMLQGIGAASPSSMSLAICRDRYQGKQRQQMLAYIGVVLAVMPATAPSIGSALLAFVSWRWIFITQGMIALVSLLFAFGYEETAQKLSGVSMLRVFARYRNLFANRNYLLSCTLMGIVVGPFFGYIAFSPIVYMTIFGCTKGTFSLLFGLNAVASMLGSFLCARLTRYFSTFQLLTAGFWGILAGGLIILTFGHISPYVFFLGIVLYTFCLGISRPVSNHLVLEQVREDIGSASSFMVFYMMMVGSLCMWIAVLPWTHPILSYGLLATSIPAFVLAMWPYLRRRLHGDGR